MFFNKMKEIEYVPVSELIRENSLDPRRVYEWIRILEASGKVVFDKTPYGKRLITKEQSKLLFEYSMLEEVFDNPNDILSIIFNSDIYKETQIVEEDLYWTKGLKNIIWRKY